MKPLIKNFLALLVLVLVAVAAYTAGKHQPPAANVAVQAPAQRKLLYYRNPMGLPDTSPVPKQDSMGMDYVPVYEGEDAARGTVSLAPEKVQKLGVRTEAAQQRALVREVQATGLVEVDERKQQWIAPRFAGWVQRLQVNATGLRVTRGQPLLTVYSPDLESAVREVQLAQASGLHDVEKSARSRLDNWQIAAQDLASLQRDSTQLVLRSPINGVVVEKMAIEGARFGSGDVLFKLADLSDVWVQAEVAEQDQGSVRLGQAVDVRIDAYPQQIFPGKVSFIAPLLNEKTRTVRVRVELPNLDGRLRPGMYANVAISEQLPSALTVPVSAVIDSGARQVVLVQVAEGHFQPRNVKLGARNSTYVEVQEGVGVGEQVVTRANFLIDAESNLRAALSGMYEQKSSEQAASGEAAVTKRDDGMGNMSSAAPEQASAQPHGGH